MLEFLKGIFKIQEKKNILYFTEKAKNFILKHLQTVDKSSVFILQISRDKKGRGIVQCGFDLKDSSSSVVVIDRIPIQFRLNSKEILSECGIDLDQNGNVLVYPQVDLSAEETPNPQILLFVSNKRFVSEQSPEKIGIWVRNGMNKRPALIDRLFKFKYINSIYLVGNKIQIEIIQNSLWKEKECEVSNVILDYLEGLPRPIQIHSMDSTI